jgi:hypothetical protein
MKSFGFLLLALISAHTAFAELDTLWSKQIPFNGQAYEIMAATVLNDGGVAASSVTYPSPNDQPGLRIWRLALNGDPLWERNYGAGLQYLQVVGLEEIPGGNLLQFLVGQADGGDTLASYVVVRGYTAAGDSLWERRYQFPWIETMCKTALLADGNVVLASTVWDVASGFYWPLLMKFNANGDTLWTRTYPVESTYYARGITELPNGNLVMAQYGYDAAGMMEARAVCVTATGAPVWTVNFEVQDLGLNVTGIASDGAGNIVICGSNGGWEWSDSPWAVALDASGDVRWELNPSAEDRFTPYGSMLNPDGGAVLVSTRWPDFGFPGALVHSVDAEGNLTQEADFSGMPSGFSGLHTSGARGAIAYGFVSDDAWQNLGFLMRFGPGTSVTGFVRHLGTNTPLEGVRVEAVETGEYVETDAQGIFLLPVSNDTATIRVSSPCIEPIEQVVFLEEGEQNTRNFAVGMPEYESDPTSLNMVATFHLIARDTITIFNSGNGDLIYAVEAIEMDPDYDWLSAIPESGVIEPGNGAIIEVIALPTQGQFSDHFGEIRVHHNHCPDSVDEIGVYMLALDTPEHPGVIEEFSAHPAYPNPFNAETTVRYDLPSDAHVKAALYDILGQQVSTLIDEVMPAGSHNLRFSGGSLSSGVYLLRVQASDFVATQKLVLLR